MIKFFRHIRKSLLIENKTGKYFKYAIGEIILVVIGILIALQINNWNENRKAQSKEQVILKTLKASFLDNIEMLEYDISSSATAYNASLELKKLIKPEPQYTNIQVDSLITMMFYYSAFDAASGAIDEIINSGQLNIIRNKELKNEISKWSSIITDAQLDIDVIHDYSFKELIIYLSRNAKISNQLISNSILERSSLQAFPESNFEANYKTIMSSLEFENMVNWHSINLAYLINEYNKIHDYLDNTVRLLDSTITNDHD